MKRAVRWSLLAWLVLWLASTGYRSWRGFERPPGPDQIVMTLMVAPSVSSQGKTDLAYRDLHKDAPNKVPWLLLHGNPMAGRAMLSLASELGSERRILIPDLPGLGHSSRNLTAYSAENQVTVLLEWLHLLHVGQVHVIGYSQGSAVALELADRAPELVASVSLVAGVGLQEYELLGSYEWNQPLYAAYQALLWTIRWGTPHFGIFDAPMFSTTSAQNFADTDLRRNLPIFKRLNHPVLILHSLSDRLVPYAAARAHADLLPQADFLALPGGHMGIFSQTKTYADALRDFINSVEGTTSATAQSNREAALQVKIPEAQSIFQDTLIAFLLLIFVFFSEDLSCIAGGILAAAGMVSLPAAIAGCFLGIFISDLLLFWLGRIVGEPALKVGFVAKAAEGATFKKLRDGFDNNVFRIVFITRFIPGSRVIAYVTAGVLRVNALRFMCSLVIAAGVWTPVLVSIAYFAGQPLIAWWERSGWVVLPLILVAVIAIYLGITACEQSLTYYGRRQLRGRWIRLTRWEFWPAWAVYLPVVFYGLFLAFKYRGTTLWAMCNPGMSPLSGLAMESKSEILSKLNVETRCIADWACIRPTDTIDDCIAQLNAFRAEHSIDWPLILKPDIGQRGEGVAIIRSEEAARQYLSSNHEPVIAQRYIAGAEFGVFYYRMPREAKGRIFSITEKVLPELKGDGVRTLERLILDDSRAVAQAKHYLKVNAARLEQVLQVGETAQIVELGTHCRGAIFLDGNRYKSEALAARLDQVLSNYQGFYFGRFDVRVPSGEKLQQGDAFSILELNGVSSESTDIYDPGNSIFHGWRKLCRQWRLAFEIRAANRASGTAIPSWVEVISVLRAHSAREPYEVD